MTKVSSAGDNYDNAPVETINGLCKNEVIRRCGPWHSFGADEYATPEWVDWLDNRPLLDPIGNTPPTKASANLHGALQRSDMAA